MARMSAVKRTRLRSSGTRQAFASQLNTLVPARLGCRLFRLLGALRRRRSCLLRRLRLAAAPALRPLLPQLHDRAPSLFDLRARCRREAVRRHVQPLRQLALAEDLDVYAGVLDQPSRRERLGRNLGPVVEAVEIADVERVSKRPEGADRHGVLRVGASLFTGPHVSRHLSALETRAHLVGSRARLLALDSATRVAALPRAQATAEAPARPPLLGRLETGQGEIVGHWMTTSLARREPGGEPFSAYRRAADSPRARR